MDCLCGFLSSISRDLVCAGVKRLSYPCCFKKFYDEVRKGEETLVATRDTVQKRVEHTEKQGKKSTEVVKEWLNNANNDVENVKKLLEEAKTNKTCCCGLTPDWIWRYKLGKKLANKKEKLEECIENGKIYAPFERTASLPFSTVGFLSDNCLNFESRKSANQQLMEALRDDEVGMIGLYGMGGCGKTTLALEIGKKAEEERLFDKVLFVPVSKSVEVRRIQEKIASSLPYEFSDNEEEIERAKRLFFRLTKEKRILVILDDVWQKLNFRAIGIPSHEESRKDHKICKVLITTRSENVCKRMNCQTMVSLEILSDEEAWILFQKQVDMSEEDFLPLKELGKDISDECKGLPVAIAAVAGSLKDKVVPEWEVALYKLRNSIPVNIEKDLQDPYKCLQLSYDYLDTEEAKSLLLLCSAFPEDYEIPVKNLTRYAIGLGLGLCGGEFWSYDAANNEINAVKNKLISSCLLTGVVGYLKEFVKLHDLIRDVCQWIMNNRNENMNAYTPPRYLWYEEFPNKIDCFNLKFIRIRTKKASLELFEGMKELRVLILENGERGKKPLSMMFLKFLTNLRYLALEGWELSDISTGDKSKLEGLELTECSFPTSILLNDVLAKELTNLRSLGIEWCGMEWSTIEVILRLSMLEELYISESTIKDIVCSEYFNKFIVPQSLQRYNIHFGERYRSFANFFSCDRALLVDDFHPSNEIIKGFARKAENLGMRNIRECEKNIIPDIFQLERGSINKLRGLAVISCGEIECLVYLCHRHLLQSGPFEKLEQLHIRDCYELTSLLALYGDGKNEFKDQLPLQFNFFPNLQKVEVGNCDNLKYLFSTCMQRGLSSLKESERRDCNQVHETKTMEDEELQLFPSTPSSNYTGFFPLFNLRSLQLVSCPNLDSLFTSSIAKTLTSLEFLELYSCDALKHIIDIVNDHDDQENWDAVFPKLKKLKVLYCDHLEYMLGPYHQNYKEIHILLPSLETLCLRYLPNFIKLNSLFPASPSLKELKDSSVPSKNSFTFQNLKEVHIMHCEKLDVIFPASCLRWLPELESLCISNCKELKHIIEEDMENQNLSNSLPPQQCCPKLKLLFINKCNMLKRFISASNCELPNLQLLLVNEASELEELIGKGDVKLELPKLNALIFRKLTKFRQGIESHIEMDRVVLDCPHLSLTSTTTVQELWSKIEEDLRRELCYVSYSTIEDFCKELISSGENPMGEATQDSSYDPRSERASGSGSPSSQSRERTTSDNDLAGASSTHLESASSQSYAHEWDPMPENTSQPQMNQEDPTASISELPSESDDSFESERERKRTPHSQQLDKKLSPIFSPNLIENLVDQGTEPGCLDQQHALGEAIVTTENARMTVIPHSIKDEGKKSIQDEPESSGDKIKSSSIESIDNVSNDDDVVLPELGAYKHLVDLDDAQLALLAEAIAVYPNLWNVREQISERLKAWKLKTLVDILAFLKNESAVSVTPQKEKEFYILCNDAIQLGFERSWIDEMRRRVAERDPKLSVAQARITELRNRHDQLIQELCMIKNELKSVEDSVDQTKCFDFL